MDLQIEKIKIKTETPFNIYYKYIKYDAESQNLDIIDRETRSGIDLYVPEEKISEMNSYEFGIYLRYVKYYAMLRNMNIIDRELVEGINLELPEYKIEDMNLYELDIFFKFVRYYAMTRNLKIVDVAEIQGIDLYIPEFKIEDIGVNALDIFFRYVRYNAIIRNVNIIDVPEKIQDLYIPEYKIKDMDIYELSIYHKYVLYYIFRLNIDLIDVDGYYNKYTIDLRYYWYSNYDKKREDEDLIYELRDYPGERIKVEYYVNQRESILLEPKVWEDGIVYMLDEGDELLDIATLKTDWGDKITDGKNRHIYQKNDVYDLVSTGFIDTQKYTHTGKNIISMTNVRPDLRDASWLFAENYYAEGTAYFPRVNTLIVNDMNHMFYHCARVTELDLSDYSTQFVRDVRHMFDSCLSLVKLDIRNFNLSLVRERFTDNMLLNCINLWELRLDNCDRETIQKIIESDHFPIHEVSREVIYDRDIVRYDMEGQKLEVVEEIVDMNVNDFMVDDLFSEYNYETKDFYIGVREYSKDFRKIYCKESNSIDLVPPEGWTFVFTYE